MEVDNHSRILPGRVGFLKFGNGQFFTGLLSVGRGLPGGKLLSFASPKESNQRKGDPDSPEFPKIKRVGWAAKNSPRFICISKVSGAQTPLPLIHPTHSIFGGSVRGEKSEPGW
ncbi:MAG TPA: hypothetical protein VJ417_12335 [Candidatus Glassbacteria bacterium]|nr:hypothetical protein [Candidatus Glassbacteria bacterium]